ncbi:MAG TPA: fluoride efflux transporter CrcB [Gemmatimonadaceae bacterium]|nr:fluoride efflux transporter CrcB [Gemmatimonadaceae bacterium]
MILWIALGGAAGSVLRYLVGGAVQRAGCISFPAGTLVVNVTGCFLIGILAQHYMNAQVHPAMRTLLITGFCGGYTTFSTFSLEAAGLIQGGEYGKAASYIMLSLVLSIAATFAGFAAARAAA